MDYMITEEEREQIIQEKEQDPPMCRECDEPKNYVYEPIITGFTGFVCTNEDCMMDS
jgi:hypothetical protein